MATSILITAIFALFFGGTLMTLASRRAAELDARVSLWIGYKLFPKKMRRHWDTQEEFKKFLARKKTLLVYKIAGLLAILLAVSLAIFYAAIN